MASTPSLVVGIVVDQMRYDYLFKYWNKFGNGGFKRLVNEGFLCKNAHFNYAPTYTGPGHASIFTGATPAVHGIIANEWFDRVKDTTVYCTSDNNYETVGSTSRAGKMSPALLQGTTIGDELRLYSNLRSKVIGISLKDRASILPAGHSANAAYWFDAASSKFITSSYYMKVLPDWVKRFNSEKRADTYLSSNWGTLLPIKDYTESGKDSTSFENPFNSDRKKVKKALGKDSLKLDTVFAEEVKLSFPHNLALLKLAEQELIRKSPFGNSLLKDFAATTINEEQLGKGEFPDFLSISFSSTDYVGHQFGPASIELEDTYLRLDKDIAEILNFLDNYIGKEKVLIFLTADHGAAYSVNQLDSSKIPSSILDNKKLKIDLEGFFETKFHLPQKTWISSVSNNQVFLNKNEILMHDTAFEVFVNYAVKCLEFEEGIIRCYTAKEMRGNTLKGIGEILQNGYHPKRSGDIIIQTLPFCGELSLSGSQHGAPFWYDTHVPIIFYGWKVEPGLSNLQYDITDIAPTICSFLNIEAPAGCTGKVIDEIKTKANSTH
jgi:predicted AlkP superfamily pyrophosphatase or phosphodiesterase